MYSPPATLITTLDGAIPEVAPLHRLSMIDEYAPHVIGGVEKLYAEGNTGEGILIAVIDTGVDYNHPALGGGFGPRHKIVKGYDVVGDSYRGNNIPSPKSDLMDCNGHGTHVSAIIGADPNPFNFITVVPNATLGI